MKVVRRTLSLKYVPRDVVFSEHFFCKYEFFFEWVMWLLEFKALIGFLERYKAH